MVGPNTPDELTNIAEHGRFVRNLAWRLLHDEDAAEEVVQETMLAAVKAKPSTRRSLRPWLATVARNVIRRRFRTADRVRRREEAAAKPEALPSTGDMAARAEMLKEVVDAVLALDEPNRTTVLLRYYEDLPPREIAARLGVGVETVRGRLKRAVKQLRGRLDDRHPNGRQGWVPVVAGLCGFEVPAEILAGAGGGGAGSTAAASEAAPVATSSAAGALKGVAAAFLIGAAAAGAATWGAIEGRADRGDAPIGSTQLTPDPALPSLAASPEGSGAHDEEATVVLRGRRASPEDVRRAEARHRELVAAVAALEARAAALTPAPDPHAFRFGLPPRALAFDAADWSTFAHHLRKMTELLAELREHVIAGEDPPAHFTPSMVKHNNPLAVLAINVGADLEVPEPNQAFTHPAVWANLVRAALQLAGVPLSREQEVAIRALGQACLDELADLEESLAPDTLDLARTVAIVDVKLRFVSAARDVLDRAQRAAVFVAETEGRLKLDLLSPGVVYAFRHDVAAEDRAELERKLVEELFAVAGLEVEGRDLSPYAWIGRQWVDDLPEEPEPCVPWCEEMAFPLMEDVQTEANAQVEAMQRILATGTLAPSEASDLRRVTILLRPRLLAGTAWPLREER